MEDNKEITVNPQSSIDVNFKDSKDRLDSILKLTSAIISVATLGVVTWTGFYTFQLDKKVEETKQLNTYLDKVGKIISEDTISQNGTEKKIDYIPAYLLSVVEIKQIDHLTRTYTRTLNPESKRIVLIYLYESGLIDKRKAVNNGEIGLAGKCKNFDKDKNSKISENLYCSLSTNRYDFNDIDMSGIFLEHIKLHNSYLNKTNFTRAKLNGATLKNSGFRKANFTKATLKKVDFSNWRSNDPTALNGANFTDAELQGANFTNTNLSILKEEEKEDCNKPNNCTVTNFTDAKLQGSKFINADLSEANLTGANLTNANLTNANLTNANLQGVIFGGTNLYCANLTDAKHINPEEIKKEKNWWSATYNQDMEGKLNLSDKQKSDRESTCKK